MVEEIFLPPFINCIKTINYDIINYGGEIYGRKRDFRRRITTYYK